MKNVDLWLLLKISWKRVDLHFLLTRDSWSWAGPPLVTILSTTSYCLPMYCLSHQDEILKFVAPGPEVCWGLPHPNKGGEGMQGGEKHRCQGACPLLTPQSHMIIWKKTLPHWVLGTDCILKHLTGNHSVPGYLVSPGDTEVSHAHLDRTTF